MMRAGSRGVDMQRGIQRISTPPNRKIHLYPAVFGPAAKPQTGQFLNCITIREKLGEIWINCQIGIILIYVVY